MSPNMPLPDGPHKQNQGLGEEVRLQKQGREAMRFTRKVRTPPLFMFILCSCPGSWSNWMFGMFLPRRSYPLSEAFRVFGDPEIVEWLDQHPVGEDIAIEEQREVYRGRLEHELNCAIREYRLVATALRRPLTPQSRREEISADIWGLLELDYASATARLEDIELIGIELHEHPMAHLLGRSFFTNRERAAPNDADDDTDLVSLSEDLELLVIGEDRMHLRGEIQQHIVKLLVDAWKEDRDLETRAVLLEAGSNADSIAKAFTGSPNWEKLRRHIVFGNGRCRLVPNADTGESEDAAQ
ncbi:hypothetical protein EMQ25_17215 [Arsenicitalea aurantiaca]|uniref:Uncharacterized protein n=1 Tax=Arsenicitalea aurantiaca TaxID=1783274 RepID=A0A433X2L2_9HYPH|nr:hypothetical protein [Arsenicitalea aurantiaca]RUT28325.1 hypothetical protein EMQ25_17215 [Arsenicitalea aurantiaca]